MTSRARATLAVSMIAPGLALLSGCSSGGSSNATVPAAAVQSASTKTASVTFSITLPKRASATSQARVPQYISQYTRSIVVTVASDGAPPSVGQNVIQDCSQTSCTVVVDAPLGSDVFSVELYNAQGGTGGMLSSGSVAANVVAGAANAFNVTFNPVLAGVSFVSPNTTFIAEVPQTLALAYSPLDPSGGIIVAPGSYISPAGTPESLSFRSSDSAGHVSVSTNAVASPSPGTLAPIIPITYDGTPPRGNYTTTITGTVNGAAPNLTGTIALTVNANYDHFIPPPDFALNNSATPLINGPDGNIWVAFQSKTNAEYIEKIDVTTFGVTAYSLRTSASPIEIVAGADGNIWFSAAAVGTFPAFVGKISPDGAVSQYPILAGNFNGTSLAPTGTVGPDGNVWFGGYLYGSQGNTAAFFDVATDGTIVTYPLADGKDGILAVGSGPNHSVYYITNPNGSNYHFGSIAEDGAATDTALPSTFQGYAGYQLVYGPDKNFYYVNQRISPAGVLSSSPPFANSPLIYGTLNAIYLNCKDQNGSTALCNPSTGAVTTIPATPTQQNAGRYDDFSILGSDGNIWVLDRGNDSVSRLVW